MILFVNNNRGILFIKLTGIIKTVSGEIVEFLSHIVTLIDFKSEVND